MPRADDRECRTGFRGREGMQTDGLAGRWRGRPGADSRGADGGGGRAPPSRSRRARQGIRATYSIRAGLGRLDFPVSERQQPVEIDQLVKSNVAADPSPNVT